MYLVKAGHEEFAPVESKSREPFFSFKFSYSLKMVICKG